ncbi:MAG: hypothetical protein ACRC6H_03605 [Culicoidibacterales bacterium]
MNKRNQAGIILLECLVAFSMVTLILVTIQPVLQVVKHSRQQTSALAMVQAGMPVLIKDIEASDRCAIQYKMLRLEIENELGYVVDTIKYSYGGEQLLRQKNGGYERVMVWLEGVNFHLEQTTLTVTFDFANERYQFQIKCPGEL